MVYKIITKINAVFQTLMSLIVFKGISVKGLLYKRLDTQIILKQKGQLTVGKNVQFQRNVSISSVGGEINIGDNVSFNRNCIVVSHHNITIEDNVIFGPGVTIYDHDHRFSDIGIESGFNCGSVIIEKGCWIGSNVTILRNTIIGEGSIIGAGTVVKGIIPAHSLVTNERNLIITPITKR